MALEGASTPTILRPAWTTTTATNPPARSNAQGSRTGGGGASGGQPTVTVNGRLSPCTFDGTSLESKWIAQHTANGAYHSGIECFENSHDSVSVSGGTLS